MPLEFRSLTFDDAGSVDALFQTVYPSLPIGTLNPKKLSDFQTILLGPNNGNVGAFEDGQMVGYGLSEVAPLKRGEIPVALLKTLKEGTLAASVRGTLVHPEAEGRLIGIRLLRARRECLSECGIKHTLGMMLTDNKSSVAMYLREGGILCGFDRDHFGLLNFAHYSGDHGDMPHGTKTVECSSTAAMADFFENGYVCRRVDWNRRSGDEPVFFLSNDFEITP